MKLLLYLICPMSLFIFVMSINDDVKLHINVTGLIDVIMSLRQFYSAATVMFFHSGNDFGDYGDIEITYIVHTCFRLLAQHSVTTMDIHFKRMTRTLKYQHEIVRPLAVVILSNFNDYLEFSKATKSYVMSFPAWFVLFLFTPNNNNTRDYCLEPMGNPFNLAFDTKMLVICGLEDTLREWYSVKGETVKTFDLAEWREDGFVASTKLSLYERRKDMEGVVLRTITVQDLPVSPDYSNNYVANLYGKVLEELTYSLNFTLDIVLETNDHGIWNPKNKTWSGVMGEIVSGRADFAIADMSMTSLRVRYVDFTLPLIVSKNGLFFKEPRFCGIKWVGYFQAFKLRTWNAIFMLIVITPFLLCFMKMCRGSRNIAHLISDDFISIWGIFCQQALAEFPKCVSLRVAYFTMFCAAVLILAYYSAALICFLTACNRVLPFRTIDEFIKDDTYKLIIPRGSADYDVVSASNTSFSLKLMKLMKKEPDLPMTLIDGFAQICSERKLGYLVLNALKKSVETKIPCKLLSISTERIDNLGMVLSKGNPYTGVINYHLQKFLSNGILMRLRNMRFVAQSAESDTHQSVRIATIAPILLIFLGGLISSIVILIIEKTHYRGKRKIERKRRRRRIFHRSKKQMLIRKW